MFVRQTVCNVGLQTPSRVPCIAQCPYLSSTVVDCRRCTSDTSTIYMYTKLITQRRRLILDYWCLTQSQVNRFHLLSKVYKSARQAEVCLRNTVFNSWFEQYQQTRRARLRLPTGATVYSKEPKHRKTSKCRRIKPHILSKWPKNGQDNRTVLKCYEEVNTEASKHASSIRIRYDQLAVTWTSYGNCGISDWLIDSILLTIRCIRRWRRLQADRAYRRRYTDIHPDSHRCPAWFDHTRH